MILDSSALIAVLLNEPEGKPFLDILEKAETIKTSAVTVLETSIVMQARYGANGVQRLHALLSAIGAIEVAFTAEHRSCAETAFAIYGKGRSHKAQLNFGDCITYALAKCTKLPLLYKGNDFTHTDLDLVALA